MQHGGVVVVRASTGVAVVGGDSRSSSSLATRSDVAAGRNSSSMLAQRVAVQTDFRSLNPYQIGTRSCGLAHHKVHVLQDFLRFPLALPGPLRCWWLHTADRVVCELAQSAPAHK